jgi:hypothetical protein
MKKVCKKWNVMVMIFCLVFTMMPVTAFAADATTLTLKFVTDNEGQSDLISIADVSYDVEGGEVFTRNPNTITVPDEDSDKFDATKYVPVRITDTNGNQWVLTDKGKGERKNINVKDDTSTREFHYQFDDSVNPPEPATPGSIKITKMIDGDVPDTDATFTFEVSDESGFSTTASLTYDAGAEKTYQDSKIVAGDFTVGGLTPGAYTVAETSNLTDYDEPAAQPGNVASGGTEELTFVNTYHNPENPPGPTTPGSISITKLIGGDVPDTDATFTFEICDDSGFSTTASIAYDADAENSSTEEENPKIIVNGTVTIGNLTPGAYSVSETSNLDNYDEPEGQPGNVVSEGTVELTFTNTYHKPVIDDGRKAYVTKLVAEYNGETIPNASAFTDDLDLNTLGRSVIFKITLSCNQKWRDSEYTGLSDYFDDVNITGDLLVFDNGEFEKATAYYWDFPHPIMLSESDTILYYVATLDKEGTYTNTANILTYNNSEVIGDVYASSTASVTVKLPGEDDDDDETSDNPPSNHHHDNNNDSSTTPVVTPADNIQPPVEPAAAPAVELDNVPKTGDEAPIAPFMILGALSAAILSFLGRKYWMGSESK